MTCKKLLKLREITILKKANAVGHEHTPDLFTVANNKTACNG